MKVATNTRAVSDNHHHPRHCSHFFIVCLPLSLNISWHSGTLTITVAVCAGRRLNVLHSSSLSSEASATNKHWVLNENVLFFCFCLENKLCWKRKNLSFQSNMFFPRRKIMSVAKIICANVYMTTVWTSISYYLYPHLTFHHGQKLPHPEPSNWGELSQRRLQQEERYPSKHQGQKIWDQKGP